MNRVQLEHIIRAAADIASDDEIVVIGSQSVLGQFPDAPPELLVSTEADLYPRNHPERSDLIDGSIGEGSPFHETFGYYAQGVSPGTAVLPEGWERRLVPVKNENTRGATGWCLEIHDLLLSKAAAGRERDIEFLRIAARKGIADERVLLERVPYLDIPADAKELIAARVRRAFGPDR
ncbi:MAG: hypothetical protein HY897_01290 [Deltaproteobacteria bacterium]|nr:hypothetical protein [Deltaproteobacteria bacterium]